MVERLEKADAEGRGPTRATSQHEVDELEPANPTEVDVQPVKVQAVAALVGQDGKEGSSTTTRGQDQLQGHQPEAVGPNERAKPTLDEPVKQVVETVPTSSEPVQPSQSPASAAHDQPTAVAITDTSTYPNSEATKSAADNAKPVAADAMDTTVPALPEPASTSPRPTDAQSTTIVPPTTHASSDGPGEKRKRESSVAADNDQGNEADDKSSKKPRTTSPSLPTVTSSTSTTTAPNPLPHAAYPRSRALYIDNLKRPLDMVELEELLNQFGPLEKSDHVGLENGFWVSGVKSHVYCIASIPPLPSLHLVHLSNLVC